MSARHSRCHGRCREAVTVIPSSQELVVLLGEGGAGGTKEVMGGLIEVEMVCVGGVQDHVYVHVRVLK